MVYKLKKEKKAWLRIIEAFLASLIIFSAVITVVANKESKSYLDKRVYERQESILDLIQKNETLRIEVIDTSPYPSGSGFNNKINLTVYSLIPGSWDYGIKICELNSICVPDNAPSGGKEVYYSEKLIASSLKGNGIYSPRKIVLAVWMK